MGKLVAFMGMARASAQVQITNTVRILISEALHSPLGTHSSKSTFSKTSTWLKVALNPVQMSPPLQPSEVASLPATPLSAANRLDGRL